MIATVVVIAVIAYAAFHLGHGHANYRHQKAHGLDPHLFWSLGRGPYATVRLPGNFRLGHHL